MYDQALGFISSNALRRRSWKPIIWMINYFHKCFKDLLPYSRVTSLLRGPSKAGFIRYEKLNTFGWDDGKVWNERSDIVKLVENRLNCVKLEHTAKITRVVMLPLLSILTQLLIFLIPVFELNEVLNLNEVF